jgi:hypothetical protein
MFLIPQRVEPLASGLFATGEQVRILFECAHWFDYDVFIAVTEPQTAILAQHPSSFGEHDWRLRQLKLSPDITIRPPPGQEESNLDEE